MKKYYFAFDGEVKFSNYFENDAQAFAERCALEQQDSHNWKVYNERFDLVYGVLVVR